MEIREKTLNDILENNASNMLLELPTSFGKSKIALEVLKSRFTPKSKILIVIPRLVLINNWKAEFIKWNMTDYLPAVTFVTYISFPKKADNWDAVVFDEGHHLSERCREALFSFNIKNVIILSATVNRELKNDFKLIFPDLYICKVSTKQAIKEEALPDPKVFLIPLVLDNKIENCEIIKNKSQKITLYCSFKDRWKYKDVKNRKIIIKCTQKQYYDDITALINWYKGKTFSEIFKNLFLRKSGERLKWLSDQKTSFVKQLLKQLDDKRTLVFCNSIAQTEQLGKYCINSKNTKSREYLDKFNSGKINHITSCNILDEGVNLTNCQIGIYAALNSSERMIKQKLGKL